jgi:hypothetical protein
MTKQQARNSIIKLNHKDIIKHFEYTKEELKKLTDMKTRFYFPVTRYEVKRIGFIEWDENTSDFYSYCVPELMLENISTKNAGKNWENLSW